MNGPVAGLTADNPEGPDGRSSRWDEHRVARRAELIDAAVAAINTHGTGAGMDQIAAAAGTSKPVIYRYFSDKDELFRAVGERVVGEIVATLGRVDPHGDPQGMLRAAIDGYVTLLDENPNLFRVVTRDPVRTGGPVTAVLAIALGEQLSSCGLDPARGTPWAEAAIGFIRSASLWWLDHRAEMSRAQLREFLGALLWGGAAGIYQSAGRDVDARPAPGVFPAGTPSA